MPAQNIAPDQPSYDVDSLGRKFSRDLVTSKDGLWRRLFLSKDDAAADRWGIPDDFTPLVQEGSPVRGIEIGVLEGRSACWFAENLLSHDQSVLIAIDPSNDRHAELVRRNLSCTPNGRRVKFIRQSSTAAFTTEAHTWLRQHAPFDFVYVDGCHWAHQVITDAAIAFPFIRPGGLILFDDYGLRQLPRWEETPPKPAIEAFQQLWGPAVRLLHKDWQAIYQKTDYRPRPR